MDENLQTTPSEVVDNTPTNEPIENDNTSNIVEPESDTEAVEASSEIEETPQEEQPKEQPKEELILGKYKSIEDAVEGLKNQQSMVDKKETEAIKQLNEKLAQYEDMFQKAGYNDPQQFQNAQIEQSLDYQFRNELQAVEQAYQQEVQTLNSLDISDAEYSKSLAYIESLKVDALANVKANDKLRRADFGNQQKQYESKQIEEKKTALNNQYPEYSKVWDLFFDSQPTPDKTVSIIKEIEARAVDKYKNEMELSTKNNSDKSKLNSGADVGVNPNDGTKIFTAKEISEMSDADFRKYEAIIDEQYRNGKIK